MVWVNGEVFNMIDVDGWMFPFPSVGYSIIPRPGRLIEVGEDWGLFDGIPSGGKPEVSIWCDGDKSSKDLVGLNISDAIDLACSKFFCSAMWLKIVPDRVVVFSQDYYWRFHAVIYPSDCSRIADIFGGGQKIYNEIMDHVRFGDVGFDLDDQRIFSKYLKELGF